MRCINTPTTKLHTNNITINTLVYRFAATEIILKKCKSVRILLQHTPSFPFKSFLTTVICLTLLYRLDEEIAFVKTYSTRLTEWIHPETWNENRFIMTIKQNDGSETICERQRHETEMFLFLFYLEGVT